MKISHQLFRSHVCQRNSPCDADCRN